MGIQKTFDKINQAQVVVYLVDSLQLTSDAENYKKLHLELEQLKNKNPQKQLILILNKADELTQTLRNSIAKEFSNALLLSAKTGEGVEKLQQQLLEFVNTGALRNNETIVTNTRHYDSLLKALEEIEKVQFGITEELFTNDELLGNIFANFCIGK